MKKLVSLILAIMMIAVVGAAWAVATSTTSTATLNANGEQNPFTSPDTPISVTDKILKLDKEIKAYNYDATTINAPTISYTYTIGAATVATGTTVTDKTGNPTHATDVNVTAPVKAGVVSPAAPVIANGGVVAWTTADTLTASTDGTANYKPIQIDFSSVVFTGAGVYRYVINEALTTTDPVSTYAQSGVTETTEGNGTKHTRYIDVYVRPKTTGFTNGSTAAEWDIYGFTCFVHNTSITEDNKTTAAVKSTGFVDGTTDGTTSTAFLADQYYTYNLTLTKTVVNDPYSASSVAFPFTVIFTNATVTKNIDIIGDIEAATVTGWTDPTAGALSSTSGVANIKSGGQIKYIGIPVGTTFDVYETNTATGVTYKVKTELTASATVAETNDASVNWGSAPANAVAQASTKETYQSTKVTAKPAADQDTDIDYTVAITNTLLEISPTGYVSRFAPYALILIGGIALLIIAKKRKPKEEEE